MRILALDTSTRAGGVALVEDDRVVEERPGAVSQSYGERLPHEAVALLEQRRLGTADMDLFAVAAGPGSFTGLRIGIATTQGLAFVHGRRVAAVSALDALAHVASAGAAAGSLVAAWMDAQRRDVFSALYRIAPFPVFDPRRLVEIEGPRVAAPAATLERWRDDIGETPAIFVGDGAVVFGEAIATIYPLARIVPHPLLAGAIGCIGAAHARMGLSMEPGAVRPLYVRRPDAVVERERRRAMP